MKVSLNWANNYSNTKLDDIGVPELLQKIGAQLGAVEEVTAWGSRYDKIVVAKVVTCEKHPNADKLSVCTIDDGRAVDGLPGNEHGHVTVVCGAPNVRAGLTVAWIPPGATVPASLDKEPFVLESREIRGIVSNGMLASPAELGLSDNHDGILEITEDVAPGTPFKQLYGLDDVVIDCENKMFTHRPDCFGILGVARELAGIQGIDFKSPDWYQNHPEFELKNELPLEVKVETALVPRFMAVAMNGITVGPSPMWLQAGLMRCGIKSINNIVDLTNYYMQLTGQPMHAYDYDKVKARCGGTPVLVARDAAQGEKVALLNGKTAELATGTIVIATDQAVVGIGGVMGGADTEVDASTTSIILEAATFDMYAIRRTSMKYGLFTDAVTRFNKGQSPLQNDRVLAKIMQDVAKMAGGHQASDVCDVKDASMVQLAQPVRVGTDFINTRLGSHLNSGEVRNLLEAVEFGVEIADGSVVVQSPFWRTDIEVPEDIVEEVGRLHGFDKLPADLPQRQAKAAPRNALLEFNQQIRTKLSAAGANEVLTYSFVHGDLMRKTGTDPEKMAYHIRNAISPGLQYYRTSIMPNLLEKVNANLRSDLVRSDDNEFALFEIGKIHIKGKLNDENVPEEFERVALVFAADAKTAARKYQGAAFYQAKHYLLPLVKVPLTFEPLENTDLPITAPYQPGRATIMKYGEDVVGVVGEFKQSVKQALKLPEFCAGFELNAKMLLKLSGQKQYHAISTFPKTQQDITLEVANNVAFSDIYTLAGAALQAVTDEHGYQTSLVPRDIFQAEGSDKKRVTLRIWIAHPDRTLKTEEATAVVEAIAAAARDKLGAMQI